MSADTPHTEVSSRDGPAAGTGPRRRGLPWRRVLLYGLAVLFGVLCLASIALGIRGYLVRDIAIIIHETYPSPYMSRKHQLNVLSESGVFGLYFVVMEFDANQPASPLTRDEMESYQRSVPAGFDFINDRYPVLDNDLWFEDLGRVGFYVSHSKRVKPGSLVHQLTLTVPFWFAALLFALVPFAVWWFTGRKSWLRRRRLHHGLCLNCGYDLRGNPDAAACPECGAGVAVDAAAGRTS